MKMTRCDGCRELIEYIDNPEEVMHHTQDGKAYCSSCFTKELQKARELWIKDRPCPFKLSVFTPMDEEIHCKLQIPQIGKCIKEQNCPIYNGGMK